MGPDTLLLATTNRGKLREIQDLLAGLPILVQTLGDYPGVDAPDETGSTFSENARQKALFYAAHSGVLTVAEDSGLEIDALGGRPGVHSARYAGADSTYSEKFASVYRELSQVETPDRTARFVCAIAVAEAGRVVYETTGIVEGEIAPAPRGEGGFGYDPIFFYPPFGTTLAEAGERKSTVSHRGVAFRKLRAYLEAQSSG